MIPNSNLINENAVLTSLRNVIDPELGINIVDLGLVYGISIERERVNVQMTLTTRGCPMHQSIATGVQMAVLGIPGVEEANVDLVWEPPWDPTRISEEARHTLGIYDC